MKDAPNNYYRKPIAAGLIMFAVVISIIIGCAPRSQKAADYNDSIINQQIAISEAFDALDTTFNNYVGEEMDYAYLMLRSKIETGQRVLDTLPSFNKDTILINAAHRLFSFYEGICTDEYAEIVEIMKMPDSLYTSADQKRAGDLESQIIERFTAAQEAFSTAQETFGEKYNVVFEEE